MTTPSWHTEIEQWAVALKGLGRAPGTIQTRREHLRWLATWAGARAPGSLGTSDLLAFMGAHDWALATRRGVRASLRAVYGWRTIAKADKPNPASALPIVKAPMAKPRPAPEYALLAALGNAEPRERLMLALSADLGLRRAEVAAIHTRDITPDLAGHSLRVTGKGGRVRDVPLPDALAAELLAFAPGYVFPGGRDGHLSPEYVGKRIARLLPDGLTMHTLRHRFATRAYGASGDLLALQAVLGHANANTTKMYVEIDQSRARALIDATLAA